MKHLLFLVSVVILMGCGPSKNIKFSPTPDDITTTESLKSYLDNNPSPKVVLRTSSTAITITNEDRSDFLYNAMENELLKSGFVVRDRQLFNQIVSNEKNNVDYKNIKEKTDTDLIIELIKIDPSVVYSTNKYYDDKGREKVDPYNTQKYYGATIIFKVILIDSNEFAGIYEFNYTPCTEGCKIQSVQKRKSRKDLEEETEVYEGVEFNMLEEFAKNATRKLVDEMRQ